MLVVCLLAPRAWGAPDIERHTLKSGLRVVIEQRPSMRTSVVAMSFRAGVADSPQRSAATAALLRRIAAGKLAEANASLEEVGAIDVARDGDELTTFVTAVQSRHLARVLWREAVRMSTFEATGEDLEAAKAELAEELDARKREDLAWQARHALVGLSLGRAPPTSSFDAISIDDVRTFHAGHYAPARAVLVVIGPRSPKAVLALIRKNVGNVARAAAPAFHRAEVEQQSRRHASVRSLTVHRAGVAYGFKLPPRDSPDHAALAVAAELLAGGRASRLHRALVVKRNAFSVGAQTHRGSTAGLLMIYAEGPRFATPMDLATVIQNEALIAGLDPAGVEAAKQRVALRHRRSVAKPTRRARLLAEYEHLDGDAAKLFATKGAIDGVAPGDVRRVARTHFQAEHASVVECFPARIFLNKADQAALEAKREKEREEAARRAKKKKTRKRRSKKATKKKRSKKSAKKKRSKKSVKKKSAPAPKKRPRSKKRRKRRK